MSKLEIIDQPLPGISIISLPIFKDFRGIFLKNFNENDFKNIGLDFSPAESFLTKSSKNVLRGMHFQTDIFAHKKLIFCSYGKVLDVIVDVRKSSDYFNKPFSKILDTNSSQAILIDKGFAHGFLSLEDESCMFYMTSTVHNPNFDKGILWSSINFNWPISEPIISKRDLNHPSIESSKCIFS